MEDILKKVAFPLQLKQELVSGTLLIQASLKNKITQTIFGSQNWVCPQHYISSNSPNSPVNTLQKLLFIKNCVFIGEAKGMGDIARSIKQMADSSH